MEWKVKSRARARGEEQYAGHGMHDGNAYSAQYVCRTHLSMGRVESDCLGVWVSTLALYNTIIFSPICRPHPDFREDLGDAGGFLKKSSSCGVGRERRS